MDENDDGNLAQAVHDEYKYESESGPLQTKRNSSKISKQSQIKRNKTEKTKESKLKNDRQR
jgi:hypothetical protein